MRLVVPALAVLLLSLVVGGRADRLPYQLRMGLPPLAPPSGVSLADVERTVDLLAELMEERTLPSGERLAVSRLAVPTLQASDGLCRAHSRIFWDELTGEALWPKLMLDATGKVSDGILAGNVNIFGSFDECQFITVELNATKYPDLPTQGLHFVGRYVPVIAFPIIATRDKHDLQKDPADVSEHDDDLGSVIILPSAGMPTGVIGMCVPSSCSGDDVARGLQLLLGRKVSVSALESTTSEDSVEFTPPDRAVITIMALFGGLMVAGTCLDLHYRGCTRRLMAMLQLKPCACVPGADPPAGQQGDASDTSQPPRRAAPGRPQQALLAFSVYTNTQKLLDTTPREGTLACLHGIRFFTMTWVVLGHACGGIVQFTQNVIVAYDYFKSPLFEVVANAMPSVDTFFLLSGVLVAYGFCNVYEKTKKFNLPMFYIHRYLRLTAPYAFMIAIASTWFIYIGDGPVWSFTKSSGQLNCVKYWWRNLFYIQNFFSVGEQCLAQSWYLAVDMQMFVFAPLVLLPLVWRPVFGLAWLGLITTLFLILRMVLWGVKDMPPIPFGLRPENQDELMNQYMYPWMRCTVWLVGIGLGFLLHKLRGRRVTLRPWQYLPGWIAAFAVGISVVYGMYGYQMPWDPTPSKAVAVAYGGLHRLAWGLAVSWVIFACVTGYGGAINTFLSYPGFVPLSRLTYAGYLIHINVLYFGIFSSKGVLYYDGLRLVYWVLSQVIVTFAFAYAFSMTFEAPFVALEKVMFSTPPPRHESHTDARAKQERVDAAANVEAK
ncbi:nose resistant to fluoxetine protein 6-like [Pollicipes pollicipes]|uniref:nose resistant to fluoxetine protein 6-like n=1 Tax=Pollicipes pollicipes TaxID=41117 RepID=UPI001885504A|nr:nose resistant to fluoxetine protein 6-like [Pollicipes pollicipes]